MLVIISRYMNPSFMVVQDTGILLDEFVDCMCVTKLTRLVTIKMNITIRFQNINAFDMLDIKYKDVGISRINRSTIVPFSMNPDAFSYIVICSNHQSDLLPYINVYLLI